MNPKEKLKQFRTEIDTIDKDLVSLFEKRMTIADKIADVKAKGNFSIMDEGREKSVVDTAVASVPESFKEDVNAYMRNIIALSRLRQREKLLPSSILFPPSKPVLKEEVVVAFQGVKGAWGEHGAIQLFKTSTRKNYDYFEDVFDAVKSGEADYGVVPIENSQTGAIGEVYDLLRRHGCYIVAQTWVMAAHCLVGQEGAVLSDIREVYSHPEGFRQCHNFIKGKNFDLTTCKNTAVAAELVSKSGDKRFAAICSRKAAENFGLSVIAPDIMDNAQNKTRFIAIALNPSYDDQSDMVSITFSTAHKSGALCNILQTFMFAGINLSRIESRPTSEGKYRFFADLQANILDEHTMATMRQASVSCEYFEILGCYTINK